MSPNINQQAEPKFEDMLKRLEEIVKALESPDVSLEEGLALYKEGAMCSRICRDRLDKAQHEIQMWRDGNAITLDDFEQDITAD